MGAGHTYLQRWAPRSEMAERCLVCDCAEGFGRARVRAALLDLQGMVGAQWDSHDRLVPVPIKEKRKFWESKTVRLCSLQISDNGEVE
jgi:hypothetical protein